MVWRWVFSRQYNGLIGNILLRMRTYSSAAYNTSKTMTISKCQELPKQSPGKQIQLLRSLMFCPPKNLLKYMSSAADVLVLDMEDAVPMDKKAEVRRRIHDTLLEVRELKTKIGTPVYLRLNSLEDMAQLKADISMLVVNPSLIKAGEGGLDGLLLPKVRSAADVHEFMNLVTYEAEKAHNIDSTVRLGLIPVIETASAVLECAAIAKADSRNVALVLGHVDLLVETGGNMFNASSYDFARNMVVIACRAANLLPIDAAYPDLQDNIGYEADCRLGKNLGFAGKAVLHPSQLSVTNIVYSPDSADISLSKKLINENGNGKTGIYVTDRRQIMGPPFLKVAEKTMQQHDLVMAQTAKRQMDTTTSQTETSPIGIVSSVRMPTNSSNINDLHIGDVTESLLELTVSEAMKHQWNESFFDTNRLFTSDVIAKLLGFPGGSLVPYSLLFTFSVAMSVINFSENAVVFLGMTNATQHFPVYSGDTLRNYIRITGLKNTADGKASVIRTQHSLVNQRGETVFTTIKATMFAPISHMKAGDSRTVEDENSVSITGNADAPCPTLLNTLLQHAMADNIETFKRIRSMTILQKSCVLVHRMVKVFGGEEQRGLVNMLRVTNMHHYNHLLYKPSQLLIAGPLNISATLANTAIDLGHVLYQKILHTSMINSVNPGDAVGSVSYIVDVRSCNGNSLLEEVDIYTLGIKNTDMNRLVRGGDIELPAELWYDVITPKLPRQFEALMLTKCPTLYGRIVCQIMRTILRVKATNQ